MPAPFRNAWHCGRSPLTIFGAAKQNPDFRGLEALRHAIQATGLAKVAIHISSPTYIGEGARYRVYSVFCNFQAYFRCNSRVKQTGAEDILHLHRGDEMSVNTHLF